MKYLRGEGVPRDLARAKELLTSSRGSGTEGRRGDQDALVRLLRRHDPAELPDRLDPDPFLAHEKGNA